jgi:hypothetical protein
MAAGEAIVNTSPTVGESIACYSTEMLFIVKVNTQTLQRKAHEALYRYSIRTAFCNGSLGTVAGFLADRRGRGSGGARRLQRNLRNNHIHGWYRDSGGIV